MTYQHQSFPSWRYGPNGAAVVVNSEDETPKGFSKTRDKSNAGTQTAVASPNAGTSPEKAAKTTDAVSRASTDVAKAAKAGVGGAGDSGEVVKTKPVTSDPAEIDADGHAYNSDLHAATKSKTKAGLWRMKVGVARPDAAPGFPKPPLDL